MTRVDQTLPIEIWADILEDAGVDTSELRAWLSTGLGHGYDLIDVALVARDELIDLGLVN